MILPLNHHFDFKSNSRDVTEVQTQLFLLSVPHIQRLITGQSTDMETRGQLRPAAFLFYEDDVTSADSAHASSDFVFSFHFNLKCEAQRDVSASKGGQVRPTEKRAQQVLSETTSSHQRNNENKCMNALVTTTTKMIFLVYTLIV